MIASSSFPAIAAAHAANADASAAINAFLAASKGAPACYELAPGSYVLNAPLVVQSGSRLLQHGVTFVAGPGLPDNMPLMLNAHQWPEPGEPWDEIVLDGHVTFDGSDRLMSEGLLSLLHVRNTEVRGSPNFVNAQGSGIVVAYADGVIVDNPRATNLGVRDDVDESAAAVWVMAGAGGSCRNVTINNPRAENLRCGAIAIAGNLAASALVEDTVINGPQLATMITCGIFHNDAARGTVINGGYIRHIRRRQTGTHGYSSSGIEAGGSLKVIGVDIEDCDNEPVSLMDIWDTLIDECTLAEGGQDTVYAGYAHPGLIQHLSTLGALPAHGLAIGLNILRQTDRRKVVPIRIALQDGAKQIADVRIDNQGTDGEWLGGIVRAMMPRPVNYSSPYPIMPYAPPVTVATASAAAKVLSAIHASVPSMSQRTAVRMGAMQARHVAAIQRRPDAR